MKKLAENAMNAVFKRGQLEGILIKCIQNGKAEDAKRVAKRLKRKLHQKEIDLLVEKVMEQDMWEALEISDWGVSQKVKDALAKYVLLERGDFEEFEKFFKAGKVSKKGAKIILRESIERGWLKPVKLILPLLKRRITRKEAITFMHKAISRTNFREQDVHEVICMRKGDKMLARIFLRLLVSKGLVREARRAADEMLKRKLSRRELDQLVMLSVQKGRINRALEVAGMGASAKSIELIVEACIKMRDVEDATKAAMLNKRSLTPSELQAILDGAIEEGLVYHTKEVIRASKLVPTESQWGTLLSKCLKEGNIEDVFEVERLRKKELSNPELSLLAEVIVVKKYCL